MSTTAVVFTIVAAFLAGFSAVSLFLGAKWVGEPLAAYRVPRAWWVWLGVAKAAGAAGLMAGLVVPAIGIAAAIGLGLFTGAVLTVVRARVYAHIAFPVIYGAPAVVALALGF